MVLGPSLTVEYRTIIVPVVRTAESEEALVAAARVADERAATVAVVHVIELPLDLPLDVRLPDVEEAANETLDSAAALVESYGVRAVVRLVRARAAGPAIVEEADRRNAELVVLGAPRGRIGRRRIFGRTVDYVLKHSPSRVMIAAGRRAA
jgi:basic amino acid/polyamine antiporter, APA family